MLAQSKAARFVARTSLRKIGRLCDKDQLDEALLEADLLYQQGVPLCRDDAYRLLQACTRRKDLASSKRVQSLLASSGHDSVPVLGDHLIRLFTLCGSLQDAVDSFRKVLKPSVYTWNGIISAYLNFDQADKALDLYDKMQKEGSKPDRVTFLWAMKACSSLGSLDKGRQIHGNIVSSGLESNTAIGNMLVHMYFKCGCIKEASVVFDDLHQRDMVSWNAMIGGYAQNGEGHLALCHFEKLLQEGLEPGDVTFSYVLKAVGSTKAIHQGRQIHSQIRGLGLLSDVVIGSALVDMYVRCGEMEEARATFDSLPMRDTVLWGTMISGYAQNGHGFLALELFEKMQHEHVKPDRVIYLSSLKACGLIGAIEQGRSIHEVLVKNKMESGIAVGNALIDMYARCGRLHEACKLFSELPSPDVFSWGAIIAGYVQCGESSAVHCLLEDLQHKGLKPDHITFTSLLTACSNAGSVQEGCLYFKQMFAEYNISPSIEHYNCLIDLLGRAGRFIEADDVLQTIPVRPDMAGWTSLLAGCKTYTNVGRARHYFDKIFELDCKEASGYVLMSNVYADSSLKLDAEEVQELRISAGAWKKPGQAWIEVNNMVFEFIKDDITHYKHETVSMLMKRLNGLLKEGGYVPHCNVILH